jgi:hypothetical protein
MSIQGFSQIKANDVIPLIKVAELLHDSKSSSEINLAIISQVGMENLVWMQQVGSNQDLIRQIGISNSISIAQHVSEGHLKLEQYGTSNQYKGMMIGEDIELSILQAGESNTVSQYYLFGNGTAAEIVQEGVSNEIQHHSDGSASPIKIFQRGNDMRLIITQRH